MARSSTRSSANAWPAAKRNVATRNARLVNRIGDRSDTSATAMKSAPGESSRGIDESAGRAAQPSPIRVRCAARIAKVNRAAAANFRILAKTFENLRFSERFDTGYPHVRAATRRQRSARGHFVYKIVSKAAWSPR